MTMTLPSPVKFPGYDVATPRPGGGWERRRGVDPTRLPLVDLDTIRKCPTNGWSDPKTYDKQWCCTAHLPEWHITTVMNGHVVAVWRDTTVDAAARVARVRADESEAS